MVHVISSIVCDDFQELIDGEKNYISVFDELFDIGIYNFDFVTKWYGNGEIISERVEIICPAKNVICLSEQELKVDGTQITLNEFEVNFETFGEYWILLYESDKLINKIPIQVIGED